MNRSLINCDAYVTTSIAAKGVLEDHFKYLKDVDFRVIEHGRDRSNYKNVSGDLQNSLVRVVCFGNFGVHKGIKLIEGVMDVDKKLGPRFEFHILGDKVPNFNTEKYGCVYYGPYKRDTLMDMLAEIRPSFSIIASIWPETYCHTLTESWMAGLPVFASDIGTLRERVTQHGGGWLLDHNNPQRWYKGMTRILDTEGEYDKRLDEIRTMQLKSVKDMAVEYQDLYEKLLREYGNRHVVNMKTIEKCTNFLINFDIYIKGLTHHAKTPFLNKMERSFRKNITSPLRKFFTGKTRTHSK